MLNLQSGLGRGFTFRNQFKLTATVSLVSTVLWVERKHKPEILTKKVFFYALSSTMVQSLKCSQIQQGSRHFCRHFKNRMASMNVIVQSLLLSKTLSAPVTALFLDKWRVYYLEPIIGMRPHVHSFLFFYQEITFEDKQNTVTTMLRLKLVHSDCSFVGCC